MVLYCLYRAWKNGHNVLPLYRKLYNNINVLCVLWKQITHIIKKFEMTMGWENDKSFIFGWNVRMNDVLQCTDSSTPLTPFHQQLAGVYVFPKLFLSFCDLTLRQKERNKVVRSEQSWSHVNWQSLNGFVQVSYSAFLCPLAWVKL